MLGPLYNVRGIISAEKYDGARYPRIASIATHIDGLRYLVIGHYLPKPAFSGRFDNLQA